MNLVLVHFVLFGYWQNCEFLDRALHDISQRKQWLLDYFLHNFTVQISGCPRHTVGGRTPGASDAHDPQAQEV